MFHYRGPSSWIVRHPLAGYGDGRTYGALRVPRSPIGSQGSLGVIFSDGSDPISEGWEHVSVSAQFRTPSWDEMVWIKSLFWDEEDCVVQFHPPKSQYVNRCEHCLHLWRHVTRPFQLPPKGLVG